MQHVLTPYAKPLSAYVWWDNAFSEQELDQLQQLALKANEQATIGDGATPEELSDIRRSKIYWMHKTPEYAWVFERLGHVISHVNAEHYHFDLTGFGEAIQLTNYDHSDHGMYGWHRDYLNKTGVCRKLSVVLQLTDPSQYEGGNLEVSISGEPAVVSKRRGLIALFPSFHLHQVTPVTQGSRQSLVAWITGPEFK